MYSWVEGYIGATFIATIILFMSKSYQCLLPIEFIHMMIAQCDWKDSQHGHGKISIFFSCIYVLLERTRYKFL